MTPLAKLIVDANNIDKLVVCLKELVKRDGAMRKDGRSQKQVVGKYVYIGDVYLQLVPSLKRLVLTESRAGMGVNAEAVRTLAEKGVVPQVLPDRLLSLTIGETELRIFITPE